jgi:hypothetical protein
MRSKKVQVALEHGGRPPLPEAARAYVRQRSRRQSFVADLTSIISAAHKLPAEVDPPARVWASLHAQLEREGLLGRSVSGRLQKRTRFPLLTKIRKRSADALLQEVFSGKQS